MTVNLKFVQTSAIALYTGISGAATSMRITPYPVDLRGVKLTISDFGNLPTVTVDPKISSIEEIISFTAIVDNGDNTATLTGLTRDLDSKYPYTGSGTGRAHGASAVVVFSDNPQTFGRLAGKDNDEIITGQWTFLNTPIVPGSVSNASTTVKGVARISVAPVDATTPIAVGDNDTRVPTIAQTTYLASIAGYKMNYAADTGTANTYAIAPSPAIASYVTGMMFSFKSTNANTAASTLNINALGAKTIKKNVSTDLLAGDIAAGQDNVVIYDGTNFQLISPVAAIKFTSGQTTYNVATVSGNQTIAHGLGIAPKFVKITGVIVPTTSAGGITSTTYVGGSQFSIYSFPAANVSGADFRGGTDNSAYASGAITIDATNITIAWTKNASPTGTMYLLWEAHT